MAEHTIFGATAPPGTYTLATDGSPNIRLGATYYQYGAGAGAGMQITGGRVWCPVGVTMPATVRIMLWAPQGGVKDAQFNLNTTPDRSVEVATVSGGWAEARWTGMALPPNGYLWMIGYEFVGGTDDDKYLYTANSNLGSSAIASDIPFALCDLTTDAPYGPGKRSYFRIGTGSVGTSNTNFFGIDTIVSDSAGNAAPTANAGPDQTVSIGTQVTLTGAASSDTDGTIASYAWTQTSGTAVTLSGTGATRTFTPATVGTRVFSLTVTDDDGATSAADTVTITVNSGNAAPVANAGSDQSVAPDTLVTLSGSGSTDSDGTIASYAWTQTSGTAVTLSGTGATRTFTPTTTGTRTFELTVTDDDGATDTDTVNVVVATVTTPTVVQENAETTGRQAANQWFDGLGDHNVDGFVRSTYYAPGQTAQFSINHNAAFNYTIRRLGYYGGDGARQVLGTTAGTPTAQPGEVFIPNSNGAVTCAAWSVNATWAIPTNAVPGWYQIVWRDASNSSLFGYAIFIVSDAAAKKPVLVVASDTTWHAAYNGWGGNNVYGAAVGIGSADGRALCSTYDKPVLTLKHVPQTHFFNGEYATLRFFERVGFEVGYATQEQINADPTIMDGRELIVFSGHNEYTSQAVMDKTLSLLDSGQNMLNLSANDYFWRIKLTDGTFASTTNGRNMWCKKDTLDGPSAIRTGGAGTPFTTEADWTGTWQDSRWSLNEPSWELFGDRFIANGIRADAVKVPFSMKTLPPWRNCTGVQALTSGQEFGFGAGTAGMEWDYPYGSLPSTSLSASTVDLTDNAADINGQNYNTDGTFTHAIQAVSSSAGVVINFNTTQWGWALDDLHVRGTAVATTEARQATLNVMYDLGASAHTASITAASLVEPTPVASLRSAYDLDTLPAAASGALSLSGQAQAGSATTSPASATGALSLSGSATAIATVPRTVTPTVYSFNYADGNAVRMTEALTVRPSDGRVHVIASAGRIWMAPATLSTSGVNTFTSSTQLSMSGDVTGASWSPDGSSIAFITRNENIYIYNSSWVQQSTYTAPQAGGNTEAICWSADGSKLYFCYDNAAGTGSALYSMVPGSAAVFIGTLPAALSQTSGLTASTTRANVLYGVLDYSSGGNNKVYGIDATNATVIETITLTGATNYDWEDIEVSRFDGTIWVGDHGNYGSGAALGRATHQLYQFTEPGAALATGALSLSGTGTAESGVRAATATGVLSLSGGAGVQGVQSATATGALSLSGAAVARARAGAGTGVLSLSGAAAASGWQIGTGTTEYHFSNGVTWSSDIHFSDGNNWALL
jgi:hypothetical protein